MIKLIHDEEKVHWNTIYDDVRKIVQGCKACALTQIQNRGFHPLRSTTASLPGDLVCVDVAHMKKSMSTEGYNYCLVVIDVATRYICLKALQTVEAIEVGRGLIEIFNTTPFQNTSDKPENSKACPK